MRCLPRVRAQPLHRLVKPAAVEADRTRTSDHPCSWALALLTSRSGLPSLVNGGKRYAALSSDQGGLSSGTPMESTRVGYSCIGSFPPPGRQRYAAYTLRIVFSGSGLLGPFGCSASEQPCRVELFTPRITAGSPVFVPPGLGSPAPRFVFGLRPSPSVELGFYPLTTPPFTSTSPDGRRGTLSESQQIPK